MANDIKICTWNVRTLLQPGRKDELLDTLARYGADITALQEIRWKGCDILTDKRRKTDIYYSCAEERGMYGVGFAVRGNLRNSVMAWIPVNERICVIRMKGKFYHTCIICAYAPTDDAEEIRKDTFYDQLDAALDQCPKHDAKIIIGDFNAKVGRESVYRGVIGLHSLHTKTTDNGVRMIHFAASRELIVSSTCFPHKNIHKGTWTSPNGKTTNQIDHVLIDSRHASNILDVRSYRGANIDSDHYLVIAKLRARISAAKCEKQQEIKGYNLEALKSVTTSTEYARTVTQKLENVQTNQTVEEHWKQCSAAITASAAEVLGPIHRRPRKEWFDDECKRAIQEKNVARQKWLSVRKTRAADAIHETYKDLRRRAVHICRARKRAFEDAQMRKVELLSGRGDTRKFYQHVKRQKEGYAPPTTFCNDANGNLLVNDDDVLKRWKEYFAELLANDQSSDPQHEASGMSFPLLDHMEEASSPSMVEIKAAIKKLKRNKSPGSDGIHAELLKNAGESFTEHLHQLFQKIWTTFSMPSEWSLSMVTPIYKKGDKKDCKNYRGISVLNTTYKILSFILCERLKPYLNDIIGEYQCGFRPGKSTTDQIFTLRQILEKTHEFRIDTHHLFIDFKQAYDSIVRDELYSAMRELGIPERLILLCQMTLADTRSAVRIAKNASDPFTTTRGFRQGDALSCDLFNICLEIIIRRANIESQGHIVRNSVQLLGYADDIDIVARSEVTLKNTYKGITTAAEPMGLRVNVEKTKYMKSSARTKTCRNLKIEDEEFEAVTDFTYLGSAVNIENDVTLEISRRIMAANRTLFGLSRILRSKFVRRNTKIKIYKTLIIPVLIYGSETWTLSAAAKNMLGVFERKILRMIFGPVCEDGFWRIRYNHELYQMYKDPDIVKRIWKQQLRWLGHVHRMHDEAPPKKIAFASENIMGGSRKQGAPKLRWLGTVEKELKASNIRNWKDLAVDRDDWRRVLDRL